MRGRRGSRLLETNVTRRRVGEYVGHTDLDPKGNLERAMTKIVATTISILFVFALQLRGSAPDDAEEERSRAEESLVTLHDSDDPDLLKASRGARKSFRYFWKQVSYDFYRVVPALDVACIKLAFTDDEADPDAQVEHMWVGEIDFDGVSIRGKLLNDPNWLKSVSAGDVVECKVDEIGDWMCVLDGKVYGGYSVQVIRGRMKPSERADYDKAWGYDFPPPEEVLVPPATPEFESVIATLYTEQLEKDAATAESKDAVGRTPLHHEALYGRAATVRVLLKFGADPDLRCDRGWSPREYAESVGWTEVADLLKSAEAKETTTPDPPSSGG